MAARRGGGGYGETHRIVLQSGPRGRMSSSHQPAQSSAAQTLTRSPHVRATGCPLHTGSGTRKACYHVRGMVAVAAAAAEVEHHLHAHMFAINYTIVHGYGI